MRHVVFGAAIVIGVAMMVYSYFFMPSEQDLEFTKHATLAVGIALVLVSLTLWPALNRDARRARLLELGESAEAVIESVIDTGMSIGDQAVFRFERAVIHPQKGAYQLETDQIVPRVHVGKVGKGRTLLLKVDPADQNKITIDWGRCSAFNTSVAEDPVDHDLDQLAKLARLKESGSITEDEFNKIKQKIIDE